MEEQGENRLEDGGTCFWGRKLEDEDVELRRNRRLGGNYGDWRDWWRVQESISGGERSNRGKLWAWRGEGGGSKRKKDIAKEVNGGT